jgi:hypothetical protein
MKRNKNGLPLKPKPIPKYMGKPCFKYCLKCSKCNGYYYSDNNKDKRCMFCYNGKSFHNLSLSKYKSRLLRGEL